MPYALKPFQDEVCSGLLARYADVRRRYDELGTGAPESEVDRIRRSDGAVMLQAPTGSGKTLIAVETMARLSAQQGGNGEKLLWFWFAPFAGVTEQARIALRGQAPQLRVLDLAADRRVDALSAGAVFVTTWQSVAAANADSRRARQKSDVGLSVDALIEQARAEGYRIACVVDEAHHGFQSAKETRRFFSEVLRPDYALLMTATPNDADARKFANETGYHLGGPERWASLSRADGVEAGLLKRGVKLVRFIASDDNDKALIDFERTALDECVKMHRRMHALLRERGIGLIPLMLVQVPDDPSHKRAKGEPSQVEQVRQRLVSEWGFADSAVRAHTAKEPDPDVIALASDPTVEVLVFKMAVALGFDAPRAFTLAALRGSRDADFGVQVIGRLMRVAASLQSAAQLPRELDFGYVFLANYAAQEGLLDAGKLINQMQTQAPELGTQTVVTVIAGQPQVQVARTGETLHLLPLATPIAADDGDVAVGTAPDSPVAAMGYLPLFAEGELPTAGTAVAPVSRSLGDQLAVDARRVVSARRGERVPAHLISEDLPALDGQLEERIVEFVNFDAQVIASNQADWAQVTRQMRDAFDDRHVRETTSDDLLMMASLRPEAIAQRVERQLDLFAEVNRNRLLKALLARFRQALMANNIRPPDDEEELDRRLDLVLAHHPTLLRQAFKQARMPQVGTRTIELPAIIGFDAAGEESRRNAYGRYPDDLNNDERDFAKLLDASRDVQWWHRNPSRRPQESIALYDWDDGAGFYPDFVVSMAERGSRDGIVLVEVKGPQLWKVSKEAQKISGSRSSPYGEVIAVGRPVGGRFQRLLPEGVGDQARLTPTGEFTLAQLRLAQL